MGEINRLQDHIIRKVSFCIGSTIQHTTASNTQSPHLYKNLDIQQLGQEIINKTMQNNKLSKHYVSALLLDWPLKFTTTHHTFHHFYESDNLVCHNFETELDV